MWWDKSSDTSPSMKQTNKKNHTSDQTKAHTTRTCTPKRNTQNITVLSIWQTKSIKSTLQCVVAVYLLQHSWKSWTGVSFASFLVHGLLTKQQILVALGNAMLGEWEGRYISSTEFRTCTEMGSWMPLHIYVYLFDCGRVWVLLTSWEIVVPKKH